MAALQDSRMVASRRQMTSRAVALAILFGLAVLFLVPLYYLVVVASRRGEGTLSLIWFDGFALWSNIEQVLERPNFVRYLVNSLLLSMVTATGECILAAASGYALAKLTFPGRRALFAIVVATLALSPVVTVIPLYDLMLRFGWTSSYQGLILPLLLTGFGVFLVRQFAAGIPDALLDAARVDGASELRIFLMVAMPLLRPALLTLFLITFVVQWDNLIWPLVVSNDADYWTLPVALQGFQTEFGVSYPLLMAGTLISIVPPLLLFAALQRYYVRGLSLGSLRG